MDRGSNPGNFAPGWRTSRARPPRGWRSAAAPAPPVGSVRPVRRPAAGMARRPPPVVRRTGGCTRRPAGCRGRRRTPGRNGPGAGRPVPVPGAGRGGCSRRWRQPFSCGISQRAPKVGGVATAALRSRRRRKAGSGWTALPVAGCVVPRPGTARRPGSVASACAPGGTGRAAVVSSCATCLLMALWVRLNSSAARVKLRCRATASKHCRAVIDGRRRLFSMAGFLARVERAERVI